MPSPSEPRLLNKLARVVRRHRLDAGLTQEEASHRAGISVRHYQSLEAGNLNASIVVVAAVAHVLKINLGELG
jgi:transcriptional regulator with XRE-family HTH domain